MSQHLRVAAALVSAAALGALAGCTGAGSPGAGPTGAAVASSPTTAPAMATTSGATASGAAPNGADQGAAPTDADPYGTLNAAIDQTLAAADTGLTVQIAAATNLTGSPAVTCQTSQYQFNEDTGTLVQFQVTTAEVPDSYATNLPQACAHQGEMVSDIRVLGTQAWAMAGKSGTYTAGSLTPDAATDVAAVVLDPAIYRVISGESAQVTATGTGTYQTDIPDMSQVPMSIASFAPDALGEFDQERDTSMYTGVAEQLETTLADGKLATITVTVPGTNDATGTNFSQYVTFSYGSEPDVMGPSAVASGPAVAVTNYNNLMDLAS